MSSSPGLNHRLVYLHEIQSSEQKLKVACCIYSHSGFYKSFDGDTNKNKEPASVFDFKEREATCFPKK